MFVEYAKAAPDDILMLVTVHNRGPEAAKLSRAAATLFSQHLVVESRMRTSPNSRPKMAASKSSMTNWAISVSTATAKPTLALLRQRNQCAPAFRPERRRQDFSRMLSTNISSHGNQAAVNPAQTGTKAGALYELNVPAGRFGDSAVAARKIGRAPAANRGPILMPFSTSAAARRMNFTPDCRQALPDADARLVQRQAFAGMIWSKQFFHYDVRDMAATATRLSRRRRRNASTAATATGST